MGILDILAAALKLGLPVAGLSWLLFHRLYSIGEIDREADGKVVRTSMKRMRKAFKDKASRGDNLLHNKWMRFGGGFYGVAGLWTFIVIELIDFLSFVWNFPGFAALFEDGLIAFLFDMLGNQISNFVSAIVWFNYWPTESQSPFLWGIAAYLGYGLGVGLARKGVTIRPIRKG